VVFIAGWRQPTVGAFDIASGEYRTIEARLTSGQTAPYHRPGDVRLGADGYLYVLNNGPGDTGIYVMDRDGQVVRQIPLPNKSDHSAGFSIAGDGSFYATDMVGGRVLHYSPEGGEPQKAWGSGPGGFNNISGLYVSDDGRALVADLGNKRIHVFDVNGSFIRDYDLNCEPWLMARSGEWVDVTCGHGIVSVNLRSGDLRRSALGAGSDPLNKPVGIAHGADGLLYLLDGSRLRSYEVLR
jgi:DNA-binding beta-propeller fold protein YncE